MERNSTTNRTQRRKQLKNQPSPDRECTVSVHRFGASRRQLWDLLLWETNSHILFHVECSILTTNALSAQVTMFISMWIDAFNSILQEQAFRFGTILFFGSYCLQTYCCLEVRSGLTRGNTWFTIPHCGTHATFPTSTIRNPWASLDPTHLGNWTKQIKAMYKLKEVALVHLPTYHEDGLVSGGKAPFAEELVLSREDQLWGLRCASMLLLPHCGTWGRML